MILENIYSKIDGQLLHTIIRNIEQDSRNKFRNDISPNEEFLQLSVLKMQNNTTFRPHKHVYKEVNLTTITQESWVVLKGRVKCIYYDLNEQIIDEKVLNPHDVSVTFRGGHNYYILEDDTYVLEYKTGPYYGQKLDKEFI